MNTSILEVVNDRDVARHQKQLEHAKNLLELNDSALEAVIKKIQALQVAIPSWALGTGGTRFGRFPAGGEPSSLEEKIEDVGLIHHLTQAANSISLHIPWDIPKDAKAIQQLLKSNGLVIDSVNSNTFQDQKDQKTFL